MNLLFLGDSITDCGHCFGEDGLGDGYVKKIAQQLNPPRSAVRPSSGADCVRNTQKSREPQCEQTEKSGSAKKIRVTNGGTDGFTFPRIYQKWKRQYASASWDIVSILGGINEVGAIMDSGLSEEAAGSLLSSSEQALYTLLRQLLRKDVRRILLPEPFLFPHPAYLISWMPLLDKVRQMIRNAAFLADPACSSEHGGNPAFADRIGPSSPLPGPSGAVRTASGRIFLIPLGPSFDAYAAAHGYASVTTDGIHLTGQGHQIVCECLLPFLRLPS